MSFKPFLFAFLLLLSSFECFGKEKLITEASSKAQQKHFLWKAENKDGVAYLMGSVHLLKQEDSEIKPKYIEAYSKCNMLLFETFMSELKAPENAMAFLTSMQYPSEVSLKDKIQPKTYDALKVYADQKGLPMIGFERMRPWAIAVMIELGEFMRLGFQEQYGIDDQMWRRAGMDGKLRQGLEPVADHLNIFTKIPPKTQEQMLDLTLKKMEDSTQTIKELIEAYKTGDIKKMEEVSYRVDSDEEKEAQAELYKHLLYNRNERWVPVIEKWIKREKTILVIVGSMHLVGPKSVQHYLKASGFKIEHL